VQRECRYVQTDTYDDDPRSDPRASVFLTAVLVTGAGQAAVRIRNLSAHGALLEGPDLPSEGAIAQIRRGSLSAAGDIAWSRDQHCGLRFAAIIDVAAWIERAGPIGQQRIDAAIAEFRREPARPMSFAVLPGNLGRSDISSLSAEILRSCERMASMPNLSIEIAEQILRIEAAARAIDAVDQRSQ
jgi:hypothetical protein